MKQTKRDYEKSAVRDGPVVYDFAINEKHLGRSVHGKSALLRRDITRSSCRVLRRMPRPAAVAPRGNGQIRRRLRSKPDSAAWCRHSLIGCCRD